MVRTTPIDGQLMVCGPESFKSLWVSVNSQPEPAPVPIGRMMRKLQCPVPNPEQPGAALPIESEDEEQAFVDVLAKLEQ
ncbi:unnamed protein product [Brachionus calyciflorus]|uniref:Uncharacterized protein n=1 Tax=Brachionus calyciflorus TaxID=104777 RepID=A0A814J0L8_9BILA|nr:unnamed protein product [Brachionus calyciflorus]